MSPNCDKAIFTKICKINWKVLHRIRTNCWELCPKQAPTSFCVMHEPCMWGKCFEIWIRSTSWRSWTYQTFLYTVFLGQFKQQLAFLTRQPSLKYAHSFVHFKVSEVCFNSPRIWITEIIKMRAWNGMYKWNVKKWRYLFAVIQIFSVDVHKLMDNKMMASGFHKVSVHL